MSMQTIEAAPRYQLESGLDRLTPAERAARGKEARAEVPRESHAVFDPPPGRPDPIGLLEEQAKTRVPELVPIRRGRMMVSPFTYYRGAALPMASDLSHTPASGLADGQACGWALARAHARSGDRIAIASYLGGSDVFDTAITQFASAYADQNERDHKELVDAVASGQLTAEPDL